MGGSMEAVADYDGDFVSWLHHQAVLLRSGNPGELDLANLAEEMEEMGRSARRAAMSHLILILWHLLKWRHQPERRCNSWRLTLREQRQRLRETLADNPGLRPHVEGMFMDAYEEARQRASIETGLALAVFPEQAPFSWHQVVDIRYLPTVDEVADGRLAGD
ncbi:MAG: DUF29 domain-containing protein [Magnetococcales bacterium]|nr:DUF29 domain-containing protein [Magnetococcales bacterium]